MSTKKIASPLSQAEIDALIDGAEWEKVSDVIVTAKAVAKKETKVDPYNFERPTKFNRDQRNSLRQICDHFARTVSTEMRDKVATVVRLRVVTDEENQFSEVQKELETEMVNLIYRMQPLSGYLLVSYDTKFAYTVIERLLGAPARGEVPTGRNLTDIEKTLLANLDDVLTEALRQAWSDVLDEPNEMHPEKGVVADPKLVPLRLAQVALPNEVVLTTGFEVSIGDETCHLLVGVPYPTVQPILARLSEQALNQVHATEQDAVAIRESLNRVHIDLRAVLGGTQITVDQLMALEPGQHLPLDRRVDEEVRVYAGGYPRFSGSPGLVGKTLGIQIRRILGDDEQDFEA